MAVRAARLPGVAAGRRSAATSGRWPRRSTRNAAEALTQHRLKRASDLTARSAALTELADTLGMDVAPLRIECIDVSHVQGTDVVASLVVFEDGLPKRSPTTGGSPSASSPATTSRPSPRWSGGGSPTAAPGGRAADRRPRGARRRTGPRAAPATPTRTPSRPTAAASTRRPAGRGGSPTRRSCWWSTAERPQVNAAATELAELGIVDVTICGLAKRLEEVWVPAQDEPMIFPRTSEALYLLQRLRDEAHRFAITYHRAKRSKSMTVSALDNVAGLGEVRRKALVRHFGSVAALRRADVEEILAVPGIGRRTAEAVVAALRRTGRTGRRAGDRPAGAATGGRRQPCTATGHRYRRRARRKTPVRSTESATGYREGPEMASNRRRIARDGGAETTATDDAGPKPASRWPSSPGCPAPAGRPPPSAWRTSAGSWWTTCRRS